VRKKEGKMLSEKRRSLDRENCEKSSKVDNASGEGKKEGERKAKKKNFSSNQETTWEVKSIQRIISNQKERT